MEADFIPEEPSTAPDRSIYRSIEVLWDRRKYVMRWVLAGAGLGLVLAVALPAKYESTTRVIPSDTTSEAAMLMAGSSAAGAAMPNLGMMSDLLGMKTPGALCAALLRSDTVLDGVINRIDLRKVYSIKDYDRTRQKLAERTVVSEDKKSGIVTVTVTDYSANRAADIANAYADELDKVLQTLNTSSAHREREFLERRIEVVKQNLSLAEQQLGQFSSKNSALDIKEQGKAAFEVAGRVEGELIAAQSEVQGLRQIYGPDHPRVRAAEARVAQLRAAAGKLGSASTDADNDLRFLSISRLPVVGVAYADLYREVRVQEAVYEGLVRQFEIAKVEEVKETPRLRVIDRGLVPARRSGPRRTLLIAGGILLGFVAAATIIRVSGWWDGLAADDPRKHLLGKIVGDLPRVRRTIS